MFFKVHTNFYVHVAAVTFLNLLLSEVHALCLPEDAMPLLAEPGDLKDGSYTGFGQVLTKVLVKRDGNDGGLSPMAKIGIIAGGVIAFIIVMLFILVACLSDHRERQSFHAVSPAHGGGSCMRCGKHVGCVNPDCRLRCDCGGGPVTGAMQVAMPVPAYTAYPQYGHTRYGRARW